MKGNDVKVLANRPLLVIVANNHTRNVIDNNIALFCKKSHKFFRVFFIFNGNILFRAFVIVKEIDASFLSSVLLLMIK